MANYETMYHEAQGRVRTLVTNQNAETPVPACPGWTIKDVMAHLAGVFDDIQSGDLQDATSDERTAAHVESRRERSLGNMGAEWHVQAHTQPRVYIGEHAQAMVVDLICHEFDIRGAIGNKEGRSLPDVRTAALFFLNGLDHYLREDNVPALRIRVEDKAFTIGEGEPSGTLTLPWFELFRTLSGRRSRAQTEAFSWEGDPSIWLDHLFILGPAETDIVE